MTIFSILIFEKAWRTEEGRPAAERERRERGGRAAREGSRAAQGRHIQRQAGRQVRNLEIVLRIRIRDPVPF